MFLDEMGRFTGRYRTDLLQIPRKREVWRAMAANIRISHGNYNEYNVCVVKHGLAGISGKNSEKMSRAGCSDTKILYEWKCERKCETVS